MEAIRVVMDSSAASDLLMATNLLLCASVERAETSHKSVVQSGRGHAALDFNVRSMAPSTLAANSKRQRPAFDV